MRREEDWLRDMRNSAREAIEYLASVDFEEFAEDRFRQHAVFHVLEVIGEAAAQVSEETRKATPNIPWRNIVGMRNRLIHGYFAADLEIVWQTVRERLPELVRELDELLVEDPE